MSINIFEGARRIAIMAAVLWSVGTVVYGWDDWKKVTDLSTSTSSLSVSKSTQADERPGGREVDFDEFMGRPAKGMSADEFLDAEPEYKPKGRRLSEVLAEGYRLEKQEIIKQTALLLFGGLAVIWAFTAVAGWIIRGFLGIPSGHDRRP